MVHALNSSIQKKERREKADIYDFQANLFYIATSRSAGQTQ